MNRKVNKHKLPCGCIPDDSGFGDCPSCMTKLRRERGETRGIKRAPLSCGCTPDASGYGYCGECTRKLREKIWRKMSEKERAYDRHFAPEQSKELDNARMEYITSCSCHINPPCSYCTDGPGNDEYEEEE